MGFKRLAASTAALGNDGAPTLQDTRTRRWDPQSGRRCIALVLGILLLVCVRTIAALAQSPPPFVVQGPTVVADKCPTEITDCVSTSYPSGSPIAQHRVAPVPPR